MNMTNFDIALYFKIVMAEVLRDSNLLMLYVDVPVPGTNWGLHFVLGFVCFLLLLTCLSLFRTSNIIYNTLSLIVVFFLVAIILLVLGADFLAMLFLIVYVGAIAVLFLFVLMLLDIKAIDYTYTVKDRRLFYFFVLLILIIVYNFEFFLIFVNSVERAPVLSSQMDDITNTASIGICLYTFYIPCVIIVGLVLLVALIGCITLTIRYQRKIAKEVLFRKLSRSGTTISLYI